MESNSLLKVSNPLQHKGGQVKEQILIPVRVVDIILDINIIFETKPLTIRKITVKENDQTTSYFLLNPEFFLDVDDKFFSMANPLL